MKSDYIKAVLCSNFRFKKSAKALATEVGNFSADFAAIRNGGLIEVEIKVSKSDLNNDFKKPKHNFYQGKAECTNYYRKAWIPQYFYFAVPEDLLEYAVSKCLGKPYGIMVISDYEGTRIKREVLCRDDFHLAEIKNWVNGINPKSMPNTSIDKIEELPDSRNYQYKLHYSFVSKVPLSECVKIVKKAKKLHNRKAPRPVLWGIIARLSSEMSNLRIDRERSK